MAAGACEVNITTNNFKAGAMFDGVDDQIDLTAFQDTTADKSYSFSLWFYAKVASGAGARQNMFSVRPGNTRGMSVTITEDPNVYFQERNDAGASLIETSINLNTWNHVVCMHKDNGDMEMYLNGTSAGTTTGRTLATCSDASIGGDQVSGGTASFFKGNISNVKFWNKELTPAEIAQDYLGHTPTDNLIHRWKLYTDYNDSVGSNNGTNDGSILTITDDAIAAAIKADRTTANDKYLMVGMPGGQVVSAVIEEAP